MCAHQIHRIVLLIQLLGVLLLVGCTGIQPYEPRDTREEGLQKGLVTGEEGEFVIFRLAEDDEAGNRSGGQTDGTEGREFQGNN